MTLDVMVAADLPVVRRALRVALEADGCRIVGECVAGPVAFELVRSTGPDVVVLAWSTPELSGLDLLRQLRHAFPGVRIVVRSSPSTADAALVTLKAGADEYLETTDLAALVAAVIRPTASGDRSDPGTVMDLRAADQASSSPPFGKPGPYRVLVVDDDPTARRLLRLSLELEGAEVIEAPSLSEARDQLGRHFDGVVLDRRLPDGDGLDLLPLLAKRHPQVSIVVCSNLDDHAEPWFVLHVPKTDMEGVVKALGLVRGGQVSVLGLGQADEPSSQDRLAAPLSTIVARWTARLGCHLADPPGAAAHTLITQLVHALDGPEGGIDEADLVEASDRGSRAEVSVRQLADLRGLLTAELGRQLSRDDRAGPLAVVNRELDTWILAVVARDVERLRQQAATDPLTGLFNRRAFDEALTQEAARSSRYRRPFSVVMVDLDGLKAINDSDGHEAGDAALVAMGSALRGALRVTDSAYRMGGDEFVILLPETPKRLVAQIIGRIQLGGGPAFSWGAATYLEDTEDAGTVIDLADRQLLDRRHTSGTGRPTSKRPVGNSGTSGPG